jgi:hypothetical protein
VLAALAAALLLAAFAAAMSAAAVGVDDLANPLTGLQVERLLLTDPAAVAAAFAGVSYSAVEQGLTG